MTAYGRDLARVTDLRRKIDEQRAWMASCGLTFEGYVRRYGSAKDQDHAGDGGEAIFAADFAELTRLCNEHNRLLGAVFPGDLIERV